MWIEIQTKFNMLHKILFEATHPWKGQFGSSSFQSSGSSYINSLLENSFIIISFQDSWFTGPIELRKVSSSTASLRTTIVSWCQQTTGQFSQYFQKIVSKLTYWKGFLQGNPSFDLICNQIKKYAWFDLSEHEIPIIYRKSI